MLVVKLEALLLPVIYTAVLQLWGAVTTEMSRVSVYFIIGEET